jgi:hypothetical protein
MLKTAITLNCSAQSDAERNRDISSPIAAGGYTNNADNPG